MQSQETARMTEAEWQFEVAYALRDAGISFRLELTTKAGRLDIAVTRNDRIYGIIECKRRRHAVVDSWQLTRYRSIGVPMLVSTIGQDLGAIVQQCAEWLCGSGRTLSEISSDESVIKKWKNPRNLCRRLEFLGEEELNYK